MLDLTVRLNYCWLLGWRKYNGYIIVISTMDILWQYSTALWGLLPINSQNIWITYAVIRGRLETNWANDVRLFVILEKNYIETNFSFKYISMFIIFWDFSKDINLNNFAHNNFTEINFYSSHLHYHKIKVSSSHIFSIWNFVSEYAPSFIGLDFQFNALYLLFIQSYI